MNIKQAKEEIKHTVRAYLAKEEMGEYTIPAIRQRPILLIGPPGIGKTQIMEQIARECNIGLVSYTITHHTRQSAVGLPYIKEKEFQGKTYSVTEYTMSEIIASVYEKIEETVEKAEEAKEEKTEQEEEMKESQLEREKEVQEVEERLEELRKQRERRAAGQAALNAIKNRPFVEEMSKKQMEILENTQQILETQSLLPEEIKGIVVDCNL